MRNNRKFLVALIFGFTLTAIPVLFLEHETVSGIRCILGLILFIVAGRMAEDERGVLLTLLALWLAQTVRFSQVFGADLRSFFLSALCLLPFTVIIGIGMVLDRVLSKRSLSAAALFMVPVFYTAAVLAFAPFNLGNIFNLTTYCMCIPFLSPILRFVSEYVVTFAVMLVLSLTAYIVSTDEVKAKITCGAAALGLAVALLAVGLLLRPDAAEPDYTLNVALGLSEKADDHTGEYTREDRAEIFRKTVAAAAENSADLLVLNEKYYPVESGDEEFVMESVSGAIKEYGVPALVCFDLAGEDGEKYTSEAVFFDSEGNVLYTYVKKKLTPFLEGKKYVKGSEKPGMFTYDFNGHKINISCLICFDINDTVNMSKIPNNTELLIVPALDWNKYSLEQLRTSICSIECGATLLRHAYGGFTYVSTPFGTYGDTMDNRGAYDAIKMREIPIWEKDG